MGLARAFARGAKRQLGYNEYVRTHARMDARTHARGLCNGAAAAAAGNIGAVSTSLSFGLALAAGSLFLL